MLNGLMTHVGAERLGRHDLLSLSTPDPTDTHKPIAHSAIVEGLIETLDMRRLEVVRDEYAVSPDGARMFGFLEISVEELGVRFAIGCRNSHDKEFLDGTHRRVSGVLVCDNLAFHGDFTPVTRKHTKGFDALEVIDMAVGKMQRHFEPMKRQIDAWKVFTLPDIRAKEVIYGAFIEGNLDGLLGISPASFMTSISTRPSTTFDPRTMWSLSNAFHVGVQEARPGSTYADRRTTRSVSRIGQLTAMRYTVRLIVDSERSPQDVLTEFVFFAALKPSKRMDVIEGSVLVDGKEAAHFQKGEVMLHAPL